MSNPASRSSDRPRSWHLLLAACAALASVPILSTTAHAQLPSGPGGVASPLLTTSLAALKAAKESKGKAERRRLFAAVAETWRGTKEGAEALWTLAYLNLKDKDFAAAAARFKQVANDPATDPTIAGEALLQTGFLSISAFWASQGTEAEKRALLQQAFGRLSQIAQSGSGKGTVVGTTRSYAASGCGEIFLLQGNPVEAEKWYRLALANAPSAEPTATTMATYGLGVTLYRQGRYGEALQAQTQVRMSGKTGLMLRGLLVSPSLPAKASLWRAAALSHLGDKAAAMVAIDDCLRLRDTMPPGSWMIAGAEKSRGVLGEQVQIALDREKLLEQARLLAADTKESPGKSVVSVVSEASEIPLTAKTDKTVKADSTVKPEKYATGSVVPAAAGKGVARK